MTDKPFARCDEGWRLWHVFLDAHPQDAYAAYIQLRDHCKSCVDCTPVRFTITVQEGER